MPENPNSKEKSHPLGDVRFLDTEHDAIRINAFGLSGKKLWLFECYRNLNEFEIINRGGDVKGAISRGATTHTASHA